MLALLSGDEVGLQIQTYPKVSSSDPGVFQIKKEKKVFKYKMVRTRRKEKEKKNSRKNGRKRRGK